MGPLRLPLAVEETTGTASTIGTSLPEPLELGFLPKPEEKNVIIVKDMRI